MKKILLITYFFPPLIGGIENYYHNFCHYLPADRVVVLTQVNSESNQFDKNQKYKIFRTNFFGGLLPPRWWQLKKQIEKIIKAEGIEQIVFGHFHPLNILGSYLNLPFYIFIHGTDITQVKYNWWQKLTFRKVYKNCQGIIANSQYTSKEVKLLVKDNSKVSVIYPGVDYPLYNERSDKLDIVKRELGLNNDDLVMLSMGRLITQKNFKTIIKLMPDLLLDFPNLKYVIVGDGSEQNSLIKLSYGLNLKKSIKFVGRIPNYAKNKRVYYQLADLFVSVSAVAEGFGIVYLEAQASGLAVVASKVGGSSEAVINNQTGILVDYGDLGQIKEAIYELLNNEQKRKSFGQTGKNRVKAEFDWSGQINKIKNILK